MCVGAFVVCVPDASGKQKRLWDPPELELQVAVGCHVHVGNCTQVPWKSNLATIEPLFLQPHVQNS